MPCIHLFPFFIYAGPGLRVWAFTLLILYNRVVRKPQFPNNFRLKNDKDVDFMKKSTSFWRLVREPTGFSNKSNIRKYVSQDTMQVKR
jgi:hypothetical protein